MISDYFEGLFSGVSNCPLYYWAGVWTLGISYSVLVLVPHVRDRLFSQAIMEHTAPQLPPVPKVHYYLTYGATDLLASGPKKERPDFHMPLPITQLFFPAVTATQ